MKNWILNSYLAPESQSYLFFYWLNRYLIGWLFSIFFLIISYPLYQYGSYAWQISQQQYKQTELTEKLKQQTKLLASLKQLQQHQQHENHSFNQVNNQIQHLLQQNQLKTEQLQWQLDQENNLYLTLNHHSQMLFYLLQELNKIEHLYAKEITLTKLHQQRLVQLNAVFVLIE